MGCTRIIACGGREKKKTTDKRMKISMCEKKQLEFKSCVKYFECIFAICNAVESVWIRVAYWTLSCENLLFALESITINVNKRFFSAFDGKKLPKESHTYAFLTTRNAICLTILFAWKWSFFTLFFGGGGLEIRMWCTEILISCQRFYYCVDVY